MSAAEKIAALDAEALLAGELGTYMQEQASVRAEARATTRRRIPIAVIVGIVWLVSTFYLFFNMTTMGSFFFIILPFFGGFILTAGIAYWALLPRMKAVREVKARTNEAIAEAAGLTYNIKGDASALHRLCDAHGMFPAHNQQKFEDFWEGEIAGHPFRLFEAHLEFRSSDSDGGSRTKTTFRGPVMTLGFSRRFQGTTLVLRDGGKTSFIGNKKKDSFKADGKRLNYVALSDPRFEDLFDVYGTDQVEAHYLVNPAYMERLMDVERAFFGSYIRTLFHEGELVVVLHSGKLFESASLEASEDRARVVETINQLKILAKLAEALQEPPRN
jgi:hypothetical protein